MGRVNMARLEVGAHMTTFRFSDEEQVSPATLWALDVQTTARALKRPDLFPCPEGVYSIDDARAMLEQMLADALPDEGLTDTYVASLRERGACLNDDPAVTVCNCMGCASVRQDNATRLRWTP